MPPLLPCPLPCSPPSPAVRPVWHPGLLRAAVRRPVQLRGPPGGLPGRDAAAAPQVQQRRGCGAGGARRQLRLWPGQLQASCCKGAAPLRWPLTSPADAPAPAPVPGAAGEGEGFLRQSDEKLPGHALGLSMGKVWEVVREHKDLNLPAHRVSRLWGCGAGLWWRWRAGWLARAQQVAPERGRLGWLVHRIGCCSEGRLASNCWSVWGGPALCWRGRPQLASRARANRLCAPHQLRTSDAQRRCGRPK